MKAIKCLLILLVLISLNSCMVRHARYASVPHKNNNYYKNWAMNSYPLVHTRPPIN
jgi:hypothetical protein